MTYDPRLPAYLALAREREHPFYARQALRFAAQAGDTAAMARAVELGALDWRPEPAVYASTATPEGTIVQLRLFDVEAAA